MDGERSSYRELQPRAAAGWVEAFWRVDSAGEARRILPDGCIDFIFDLDSGYARAVGAMSRSQVVVTPAGARLFGVRFCPGSAAALIGPSAAELSDESTNLANVSAAIALGLAERVAEASSDAQRIQLVHEYLATRTARTRARDLRVRRAVDRLRASHGRLSVAELAAETALGQRQLERLFREHVGLGPKAFARVVRMQRALGELERRRVSTAAVAQLVGYADEAHMTRELRALTGLSPRRLLAERRVGFVQEAGLAAE